MYDIVSVIALYPLEQGRHEERFLETQTLARLPFPGKLNLLATISQPGNGFFSRALFVTG